MIFSDCEYEESVAYVIAGCLSTCRYMYVHLRNLYLPLCKIGQFNFTFVESIDLGIYMRLSSTYSLLVVSSIEGGNTLP